MKEELVTNWRRFDASNKLLKAEQGMKQNFVIPSKLIDHQIFLIRSQKVMFDFHLAELYGVETKILNKGGIKKS